jgi:hypothetical protein
MTLSIPDLGSLIPDPTTASKEEGGKFVLSLVFLAKNITKVY